MLITRHFWLNSYNKIEEQTIAIQTERYVIPDKPFLAKVTFKSVDSLYMSVYKIPFEQFKTYIHTKEIVLPSKSLKRMILQ